MPHPGRSTWGWSRASPCPPTRTSSTTCGRRRRLPANVDPLDSKLKDPLERARIARIFEQGLNRVGGLRPAAALAGSAPQWALAERSLDLPRRQPVPDPRRLADGLPPAPGRPALRPRGAARHQPRAQPVRASRPPRPTLDEVSAAIPSTARPGPQPHGSGSARRSRHPVAALYADPEARPRRARRATSDCASSSTCRGRVGLRVRTALCVEPRDGAAPRLHAAAHPSGALAGPGRRHRGDRRRAGPAGDPRGVPAAPRPPPPQARGHAGPGRHRGQHPSRLRLGRAGARHPRSSTKRPACPAWAPRSSCSTAATPGTGGGNHVTLGGATPADSPMLRRPDLLQSLVTYWQHHPSLSYLFSGSFIGPTSQAPRVDEGRERAALRTGDRLSADAPGTRTRASPSGWWTGPCVTCSGGHHRQHPPGRVLHRQALFPGLRRRASSGLVEFRAFEMPPHARMSVVQMLLLRALVARFWKEPYTRTGALGHGAARPLHAAPLRAPGLRGRHLRHPTATAIRSSWPGSSPSWSSAFPTTGRSRERHRPGAAMGPSSPGMCWARRSGRGAPPASWIPPWSACRSRSPA